MEDSQSFFIINDDNKTSKDGKGKFIQCIDLIIFFIEMDSHESFPGEFDYFTKIQSYFNCPFLNDLPGMLKITNYRVKDFFMQNNIYTEFYL